MAQEVDCPVDFITVNEKRVRVVALFVLLIAIAYLFTGHWLIPAFLTLDFFLRAFNNGKYSVLQWLSGLVEKGFALGYKATDRAPKRFAAQLGFVIATLMLVANVTGLSTIAFGIAVIMVVFAFLESFLSFCAGCHVYAFIKKLKPQVK